MAQEHSENFTAEREILLKMIFLALALRIILIPLTMDYFNYYGFMIFVDILISGFNPWQVIELIPLLKIRNPFGYPAGFLFFVVVPFLLSNGDKSLFYVFFKMELAICDIILGFYLYRICILVYQNKKHALWLYRFYLFNPITIYWSACGAGGNLVASMFMVVSLYYFVLFLKRSINRDTDSHKSLVLSFLFIGWGFSIKLFPLILLFPYLGVAARYAKSKYDGNYNFKKNTRSDSRFVANMRLLLLIGRYFFLAIFVVIMPLILLSIVFIFTAFDSYVLTLFQFVFGSYKLGRYIGLSDRVEYYDLIYSMRGTAKKIGYLFSIYWLLLVLFEGFMPNLVNYIISPAAQLVSIVLMFFLFFIFTFIAYREASMFSIFRDSSEIGFKQFFNRFLCILILLFLFFYLSAPRLWTNYMEWVVSLIILFVGINIKFLKGKKKTVLKIYPILFLLPALLVTFTVNGYFYTDNMGSSGIYYMLIPLLKEKGYMTVSAVIGINSEILLFFLTLYHILNLLLFIKLFLAHYRDADKYDYSIFDKSDTIEERVDKIIEPISKFFKRVSLKVHAILVVALLVLSILVAKSLNTGQFYSMKYRFSFNNGYLDFVAEDKFDNIFLSPFMWIPVGNGKYYIDVNRSYLVLDSIEPVGTMMAVKYLIPIKYVYLQINTKIIIDEIYETNFGAIYILRLFNFWLAYNYVTNRLFLLDTDTIQILPMRTESTGSSGRLEYDINIKLTRKIVVFNVNNRTIRVSGFDINSLLANPEKMVLMIGVLIYEASGGRILVDFVEIQGEIEAHEVKYMGNAFILFYLFDFILLVVIMIYSVKKWSKLGDYEREDIGEQAEKTNGIADSDKF